MKDFKIDKTGWKKVTLGEVAIQVKENIDIETTKLRRYVAGEHMISEDIHIRQWGNVGEGYLGPAFIRKFSKYDILYGSRRTYLKKVALADFEGITSNTTFVIRANPEWIDSRLLVHLILSDKFTEYSVKNSKGSVNPYINWKDIADFEFYLPPQEEQVRLAELLWVADEVVERERNLKELLKQIQSLLFEKETTVEVDNARLKDCLVQKKIKSKAPHDKSVYIGLEHLRPGSFTTDIVGSSDEAIADCFVFQKDDLLYSKLRPYLDKAIIAECEGVCTTELIVYDTNQRALKEYILNIFHSRNFLNYIIDKGFGTKMPRVSHEIVAAYSFYLPTIEEQEKILLKIKKINNLQKRVDSNIFITNQIKQNVINQIF